MSAFAVGDKVGHPSEPDVTMEVVELKDDGKVVVSFKRDDKRKVKEFPAGELSKK